MSVRAHALLQVDPGRAQEAARYLAGLPFVTEAAVTSGAYDVIATVEVSTEQAVSAAVGRLRRAPGLCALRLCRPGRVTAGV